MTASPVIIIGGGLAGCEAAWQLLQRGHAVILYEMKPLKFSPAHKLPHLAELVCSNSLKSKSLDNAHGLLKEEMRRLDSLIISCAEQCSVAAGTALAVDRLKFAQAVEEKLLEHKLFTLIRQEIKELPEENLTIIATGPLTSEAMSETLKNLLGSAQLYFYDAIAPIIEADSINMDMVFRASRYDKGTPDYLNCPLNQEEYENFRQELLSGEKVALHSFEEIRHFEGCLPVEVLAARGKESLAYGPLKPVGLVNPRTGAIPHAVIQLRKENNEGTLFNMVGFQTKLTWPEQKRIFRLIPGLENAEFARFGSIHRNTYIHSPSLLLPSLRLQAKENILLAGQITGVEGYVESAAMGLWAGLNASAQLSGGTLPPPPADTAIGSLVNYITSPLKADNFQPMNVNFGLMPRLTSRISKKNRPGLYSQRALASLAQWLMY